MTSQTETKPKHGSTNEKNTTAPKAYPPGTEIRLGTDGKIKGLIHAVNWTVRGVQYEAVYWDNSDRKTVWVEENEFTTEEEKVPWGYNFV